MIGITRSKLLYKFLTVLLLIGVAAITVLLWRGLISIHWLSTLGYKGVFVISLLNSISPIAGPSQVATFLVASRLDPLFVGISGGVGGAIGEVVSYLFGRSFRASISGELDKKVERLGEWSFIRISRERSFIPLFLLAGIPNPFFDPVSALAGSLRIELGRYFLPVLLGRTLRHIALAYAGYYAINLDISHMISMSLLETSFFVGAVIVIALFAWAVRSFAEDDPDPLLLNFTFFAFAGQCVLTAEMLDKARSIELLKILLVLDLLAFLLVIAQVKIVMWHASRTKDHYEDLLTQNHVKRDTSQRWASILFQITGSDFFPQFYEWFPFGFRNARERKRNEAITLLPALFGKRRHNITAVDLKIKAEQRKWLWRLYAGTCALSWIFFIGCIIAERLHQ